MIHIIRDSKMVLWMTQATIDDSPIRKIAKSWHLEAQLARTKHLLESFEYATIGHVFCTSNKVVYWLANQGVMNQHR